MPPMLTAKMLYKYAKIALRIKVRIAAIIGKTMIESRPNVVTPGISKSAPTAVPIMATTIPAIRPRIMANNVKIFAHEKISTLLMTVKYFT